MSNGSVRYSRAGDVFHYRWAARRCLKMLYPNSPLSRVVIEGSEENDLSGEYVIDVTEYSDSTESHLKEVSYFQLKHTSVRNNLPFQLSDLKKTIEGFAKRYKDQCSGKNKEYAKITFSIITNRPIDEDFKRDALTITKGGRVNPRTKQTLLKYTKLNAKELIRFCSLLNFADSEGDYNEQKYKLHVEASRLVAVTADEPKINNIVALVQEKALPDSDGRIVREDILKRFGVYSERDLFPAPPEYEKLEVVIPRKQYPVLLDNILSTSRPSIVHATGGVGKSIFAQHISSILPSHSLAIVYDCFGGGRYRNRSALRHRYRDALVQIANELSLQGLCDPLLLQDAALPDQILKSFLKRIANAAAELKKANSDAMILILIDAADNAEMAAAEYNDPCFVHELLRESMPDGCKLVMLCRTERRHFLQPSSEIPQFELLPFSEDESLLHLRNCFPNATVVDGHEFHRLTNNGNPRVQAYALNIGYSNVLEILSSLGPSGTTIDDQIGTQLLKAIENVKKNSPIDNIEQICLGIANLPPLIPLSVLAAAADVHEATVKSFIADLGRAFRLTDCFVQFRDEPTESWFRENYIKEGDHIVSYIDRLEPLAAAYTYVAEVLPSLFLRAEKYNKLIELALSDELLPKNNPIDERNVRVYRLQFAFNAALKQQRYSDAMKISMRAGEEVAGNKRQLDILKKNVDLIASLQNIQKVQELAYRQQLSGEWDGSANVYSASLLSSVAEFKSDARGYLRAADKWLHLYFEERKKSDRRVFTEKLKDEDICEMAYTHFNLSGTIGAVDFILNWRPPHVVYFISRSLIKKLIDKGDFKSVKEISLIKHRNQYLSIAIAHELIEIGQFPENEAMKECLILLSTRRTRIEKPAYPTSETFGSSILAFIEACAARKMSEVLILRILRHYFPLRASQSVSNIHQKEERNIYLRAVALRCVLLGNLEPDLNDFLSQDFTKEGENSRHEQEIRGFMEIIGGILPWYIARANTIVAENLNFVEEIKRADEKSKTARAQRWRDSDPIPYEISRILVDILVLSRNADAKQVEWFFEEYFKNNLNIWVPDRLKTVRSAFRSTHLVGIKRQLEKTAYEYLETATDEDPVTKAEWYIYLSRSVFTISRDDAVEYFERAIESVSKFGDEILQRWGAVTQLANRAADGGQSSPEMAYRFIRCAELIGENIASDHFDRNEAIRVCTRLSPTSTFAALSRWRDRDIGLFNDQIIAMAFEIVSSDFIVPKIAWCLSAFFSDYGLDDFAALCLEKENSIVRKQQILESAIRYLRLNEAKACSWKKLKSAAQQYSIENKELYEILLHYSLHPVNEYEESQSRFSQDSFVGEAKKLDFEPILEGLDLTTSAGIDNAIIRFRTSQIEPKNYQVFWQQVSNRINESKALDFLNAFSYTENVDRYDIQLALSCFPDDWRDKVSIKKNWPLIIRAISRRFATEIIHPHIFDNFRTSIKIEKDMLPLIYEGVIEGLSKNTDFIDSSIYFGFARIVSSSLTPQQAIDLLDFALARFELHIEEGYADGPWTSWLNPPEDLSTAFTGLIWATLGSPRTETRWRAAHCVRRLADFDCKEEIDELMHWMECDRVDSFGCYKFPFYNLHARLFLLITLARISIDKPQLLLSHYNVFKKHALESMPHVLIRKYAAEIAIKIENAYPSTYSRGIVEQLHHVSVSQLQTIELENYNDTVESYWHKKGEFDTNLKYHHEWDFDRYWFEPLCKIFGITEKQVEQLATEVIINEWHITSDESYQSDPRIAIWSSNRNQQETRHDHGSYPRVDDYSFYLSYHSMLVVAAKLLQKMPVVTFHNWSEDGWEEWLHNHSLTRPDGRWLSDRRDPAPLLQRDWIFNKKAETWRTDIGEADFLDGILVERYGETWLNIFGTWEEGDSERIEQFYVASALVLPVASESLLNALTTCQNPQDFKLPAYEEENMELNSHPFVLSGWINSPATCKMLDQYDPLAGDIYFPPAQIGQTIIEKLDLSGDLEKRLWYLADNKQPSIFCEIWCSNKAGRDKEPLRRGEQMSASLAFLTRLCSLTERELIFEIQIDRRVQYNYYSRNENGSEYKPPVNRMYILSEKGILRDTRTHYRFR